jgi:hypothetical protein
MGRPESFVFMRARSVIDLLGSGVLLPERRNYTLRTAYHSIVLIYLDRVQAGNKISNYIQSDLDKQFFAELSTPL